MNTKTYLNEYKILFLQIIIQLERLAVLICEWIIELMVIALLFIQSPGQGYFFVAFKTYNSRLKMIIKKDIIILL